MLITPYGLLLTLLVVLSLVWGWDPRVGLRPLGLGPAGRVVGFLAVLLSGLRGVVWVVVI